MNICTNPDCKKYNPKATKLCMKCWLKARDEWLNKRFAQNPERSQ